jgi:hypothetical protein
MFNLVPIVTCAGNPQVESTGKRTSFVWFLRLNPWLYQVYGTGSVS